METYPDAYDGSSHPPLTACVIHSEIAEILYPYLIASSIYEFAVLV